MKFLDRLQDEMAQYMNTRNGSKNVHIKTHNFEFEFQAKRTVDEMGKKRS